MVSEKEKESMIEEIKQELRESICVWVLVLASYLFVFLLGIMVGGM